MAREDGLQKGVRRVIRRLELQSLRDFLGQEELRERGGGRGRGDGCEVVVVVGS